MKRRHCQCWWQAFFTKLRLAQRVRVLRQAADARWPDGAGGAGWRRIRQVRGPGPLAADVHIARRRRARHVNQIYELVRYVSKAIRKRCTRWWRSLRVTRRRWPPLALPLR